MTGLLVKVCGQTRQEDLDLCADLGVDMAGFIFHPKSPRFITPRQADALNAGPMLRVGVFTAHDPSEIAAAAHTSRLDLLQLHGGQGPDTCQALGPDRVVKVLWPERFASRDKLLAEAERFAGCCHYFLLDAGTSSGGHGRTMDFDALRDLKLPNPWLLAGGLGPDTLALALRACRPTGLDLNSGLESAPGCKEPALVRKAMERIEALKCL